MMLDKLTEDLDIVLDDLQRVQSSIEILAHLLKGNEADRMPEADLARYAHYLISQALLINDTATSFLDPWLSRLS